METLSLILCVVGSAVMVAAELAGTLRRWRRWLR